MRALYYLLGAAVVFYAVCRSTELAERAAVHGGSAPKQAASPAGSAAGPWRSAPADGSPRTVSHGKGVLIEKSTGKRYETP